MDIVKKIMAAPEDFPSEMGSELDGGTQLSNERHGESKMKGSATKPKKKNKKRSTLPEIDEVDLLRKEIEEMKFYQELEQTEYQEMKEKMHTYEKQMKDMEKRKHEEKDKEKEATRRGSISSKLQKIDEESTLIYSNMDTVDLLATNSVSNTKPSKKVDEVLQKKLKKRDSEIKQLKTKLSEKVTTSKQSTGKLKALAKEYEKRLNKMESLKDEEIEEIKEHYKQLMETLAKQVQKLGKRHQEETEKNSKLRSMMEEMRNDMNVREKELEKKIKMQHSSLKKNEVRLNKAETKLDRTGNKYSSTKIELDEALKTNKELEDKLKEAEENYNSNLIEVRDKYESDREETRENHEAESKNLREAHEKEVRMLQDSFEEEISSLTGKLVDVEKLFHDEVEEHDKTTAKLEDVEKTVEEREVEIERMKVKMAELEENAEKLRHELQNEINERDESAGLRGIEHQKQVQEMAKERMLVTDELKLANENMYKLEQELKLLNEDKLKKNKKIKKHVSEIDEMQKTLNTTNEVHLKEIKNRDIEFAKARKKWSMSEQKLRQEIIEMKEDHTRIGALQQTVSGNRATEDQKMLNSQKKLIEQLKADKASLQMTVASIEGKANRQLRVVEKELADTRRLLTITNYERTLEKQLQSKEIQGSFPQEDEVVASNSVEVLEKDFVPQSEPSNNELETKNSKEEEVNVQEELAEKKFVSTSIEPHESEVSSEGSTVQVDQPKKIGLTGQRSYRNYVRNRKFSKKSSVTVRNE